MVSPFRMCPEAPFWGAMANKSMTAGKCFVNNGLAETLAAFERKTNRPRYTEGGGMYRNGMIVQHCQ